MPTHSSFTSPTSPRTARPLLQPLETRRLLACDVSFDDDGTLVVEGDQANNQILVLATDQGVAVLCDGQLELLQADGPVDGIRVDGGRGNDQIAVIAQSVEDIDIGVDGGQGNDEILVLVNPFDGVTRRPPTSESTPSDNGSDGGINIHVDGGPGNDSIVVGVGTDFDGDNNNGPLGAAQNDHDFPSVTLNVDGGQGNDNIIVCLGSSIAPPQQELASAAAQEENGDYVAFDINIEGGGGNDNISLETHFGDHVDFSDVRIRVDGGQGNDNIIVQMHGDENGQVPGLADEHEHDGDEEDGNGDGDQNAFVLISGGAGDDNIVLIVHGDDLGGVNGGFIIDGGADIDTCVTNLPDDAVIIRNCEHGDGEEDEEEDE